MNIVKAGYEILTPISEGGIEELKHIEKIGRTCYKSEDRITDDGESAKKFISTIIKSGHDSVIEHSSLGVKFIVDRGVSHEIVRHRLASFSQESTRYCNYSKDKFQNQISVVDLATGFKYDLNNPDDLKKYEIWTDAMKYAETAYFAMLEAGASPQEARSVLPNSTKTELNVTANYREWRKILNLRADKAAHPQIREVMIPLLEELKRKIPVVFDNIEVE